MSGFDRSYSPILEAKHLYRLLDALFRSIEKARTPRRLVEAFLDGLFRELAERLRFRSASLYIERASGFRLSKQLGEPLASAFDTLSPDLEPLSQVLRHKVFLYTDHETVASAKPYGVGGASAACVVGRRPRRYVYVFALDEGFQTEEVDFALNTVRAALSSRLLEERLQGGLREAAEIQASLLPDVAPVFPPFETAQRSHPRAPRLGVDGRRGRSGSRRGPRNRRGRRGGSRRGSRGRRRGRHLHRWRSPAAGTERLERDQQHQRQPRAREERGGDGEATVAG